TSDGDPYFLGAAGYIRCVVLDETDNGDSLSFLVAVLERHPMNDNPPITWASAQKLLPSYVLSAWAAKSASEQAVARAQMFWRDVP
ncbi:MAG: hypothetical protein ABI939_10060, partial [Anaerolineaceae bacterium]